MDKNTLLKTENISKSYKNGDNEQIVLDKVNLQVTKGTSLAIMGSSGSGKTTLLHILALLLNADSGEYIYNGENISNWSDEKRANFRNQEIGIIVQNYALIENESVYANVNLPFNYSPKKYKRQERLEIIKSALKKVGLLEKAKAKVDILSGGEKQRVAIARALVMNPNLILADEPTGSLDTENGNNIMDLLLGLVKEGKTLIMVTHNENLADLCDQVIVLDDGKITV